MITRSYDVIVAGFRPGGLLAGALLAKHGLRVLAINQDGWAPVTVGKYTFPSHRYPFIGFDDRELLGGAIDELTIHPNERKHIQASIPSYQVILPGQRVDVYPDERFVSELEREFPRDDVAFSALYDRIRDEAGVFIRAWANKRSEPPTPSIVQKIGLRGAPRRSRPLLPPETETVGDVLALMDAPADVRTLVSAQLRTFGYCTDPLAVPMPIAAHLLTSARGGIYGDAAGPEPLVSLLSARLKSLQCDVEPDERISSLSFGWGRLQEVRFKGYEHPFHCDYLVWNAPFAALETVMAPSMWQKAYHDRLPEPAYERYSIHIALDEVVIPVGMHDHAIIVGDLEKPLDSGNFVFVSMSPQNADHFGPAGTRSLTLTTIVPWGPDHRTGEKRRDVATRMLTVLKQVVPFMEQYVRTLFVPLPEDENDAGDPVFDVGTIRARFGPDLGPGPGLPHWNLFHAGSEAFPMLGFEGEIAAGILVAEAVLATRRG